MKPEIEAKDIADSLINSVNCLGGPTVYTEEKALLSTKENKAYTLDTECIHDGYSLETQVRLGKDSIGKDREGKDSIDGADALVSPKKESKHKYGEYQHVLLTESERERLINDFGKDDTLAAIKYLDEYIEMKGAKYKNHNLVMRKWVFDAVKRNGTNKNIGTSTPEDYIKMWEQA